MTPTRILLGQGLLVLAVAVGGVWGATQWSASALGHQPAFGAPWIEAGGIPVYPPWRFFEWWYAYDAYAPGVFLRGGALAASGGGAGILVAVGGSLWRARLGAASVTFGSSRWATRRDVRQAGLLGTGGVMLGRAPRRYLRHDGPEHVMAFAPTRSGKGVGLVVPTLLSWTGSAVVHDIKGENWSLTAGWRSRFSHCLLFDPTDLRSARHNPLLEVRRGPSEVRDVQNIADILVDPEGALERRSHWERTSHSLLVGVLLHVLHAERDSEGFNAGSDRHRSRGLCGQGRRARHSRYCPCRPCRNNRSRRTGPPGPGHPDCLDPKTRTFARPGRSIQHHAAATRTRLEKGTRIHTSCAGPPACRRPKGQTMESPCQCRGGGRPVIPHDFITERKGEPRHRRRPRVRRHHTRARSVPGHQLVQAAVVAAALLMPSSAMALDLVRDNQLTVCTSTAFPPVAYSRDGRLTGHDIAFLKTFAASRKLEIGFLIFPFDGLWLRPGRDECDIAASGITERPQRFSPGVGWSVPYYEVLRTVLIRAGDAARLQAMADFAGRTIGFVAGSTAETDTRARAPGSARLVAYGSARDGVADLLAGRIDGFAEGTISSDHFRAANPALAATPGHSMAGSGRELLGFPYRQASGIGPALDAWIRDNKARYGR